MFPVWWQQLAWQGVNNRWGCSAWSGNQATANTQSRLLYNMHVLYSICKTFLFWLRTVHMHFNALDVMSYEEHKTRMTSFLHRWYSIITSLLPPMVWDLWSHTSSSQLWWLFIRIKFNVRILLPRAVPIAQPPWTETWDVCMCQPCLLMTPHPHKCTHKCIHTSTHKCMEHQMSQKSVVTKSTAFDHRWCNDRQLLTIDGATIDSFWP